MAAGDGDDSGARGDLLANVSAATFEARVKEYQAAFRSFLEACCREDVQTLHRSLASGGGASSSMLLAAATPTASDAQQQSFAFSLRVCAQVLLDYNPSLGTLLFRHPDQFLPLFHAALAQEITSVAASVTAPAATLRMYAQDAQGFSALPLKIRQKLKVRIEFLPPVNPLRKMTISTIRSNDVKQLIQIAGTVVRTGMVSACGLCALYCSFEAACMCGAPRAKVNSELTDRLCLLLSTCQIKMQETSREYQCSNSRCGYRFLVKSDPEQGNILEIPVRTIVLLEFRL